MAPLSRGAPLLKPNETDMTEKWRPIAGFGGRYEISSRGRVRSIPLDPRKPPRILVPQVHNRGYSRIRFWGHRSPDVGSTHLVHRLVAAAFCENPHGPTAYVNHIDGNPMNNTVENLEWVTPSENCHHAIGAGLRLSALPVNRINTKTGEIRRFETVRHAAGFHSRERSTIPIVEAAKRRGIAYGFRWEWAK